MRQYQTSVYCDEVTGKYAAIDRNGVSLVEGIYEATEIMSVTWGMCNFENQTGAHFVRVDILVKRVIKIQT